MLHEAYADNNAEVARLLLTRARNLRYTRAMNDYFKVELLRQAHETRRPNVTALCRRLGISRTHYYAILQGRTSRPSTIARLCGELGVRYADVVRTDPLAAA